MNEPLVLVAAGLAGCLLGAIFFGGLWWTVRQGLSSRRPAIWFLGSFVVRTGIALAGLYFISDGHWERLLAGLFGFVFARFIVTLCVRPRCFPPASARLAGAPPEHPTVPPREARHAP